MSGRKGASEALLNFRATTIAHAIEAVAGYDGPYRHGGGAVAVGMAIAESRIAQRLGWVAGRSRRPARSDCSRGSGCRSRAPGLDPDRLMNMP